VDLAPVREVRTLVGYDAVVLGAPLIMFHWHKDALGFLARHREALAERPVAIFALGPVHDPHDAQEWSNSRAQLDKELAKLLWLAPAAVEILGGKYDPSKMGRVLRLFAGQEPATDIRDWTAIRSWAAGLKPILTMRTEAIR
jgi:menaquinone-dependent protoporphyrinogen oxidase